MSLSLSKLFKKVSKNLNPKKQPQPEHAQTTEPELERLREIGLVGGVGYEVEFESFRSVKATKDGDEQVRLSLDFEEAIQRLQSLQLINNNNSSGSEGIRQSYVDSRVRKSVYSTASTTKFVNPPNLTKPTTKSLADLTRTNLNSVHEEMDRSHKNLTNSKKPINIKDRRSRKLKSYLPTVASSPSNFKLSSDNFELDFEDTFNWNNSLSPKTNTNFSRLPTSYSGSTRVSELSSSLTNTTYINNSYNQPPIKMGRRTSKLTEKYNTQTSNFESLSSYSFLSDRTNTPYATSPNNFNYLERQRTRSSSTPYASSYFSPPAENDPPNLGLADTDHYFKQNYSFDTYPYTDPKSKDLAHSPLASPLSLPSSPISLIHRIDSDDEKDFESSYGTAAYNQVPGKHKVSQEFVNKMRSGSQLSLNLNTNEEQLGTIPNFKVKLLDPLPTPTFMSTQVRVWNSGAGR